MSLFTRVLDALHQSDPLPADDRRELLSDLAAADDNDTISLLEALPETPAVVEPAHAAAALLAPVDVYKRQVQRLADECERVRGIKDSSGDLPHMMRMIAAVRPSRPDFSFLTGWDAALMPMLLIGCDGGTNATSGVVPEITRRLYDLTIARDLDAARDLQYRLLTLFDAMLYNSEFPEGFRAALRLRGIATGNGRQPQSTTQQIALDQLTTQLQCLLAGEGFTDEPIGGCPVGASSFDPQQVEQIVKTVIGELKQRGMH